ncbi:MAG TPA: hypothetical protein VHY22_10860 [Chthoniobacteraceae bacterium]|jgi:uncharacterized protein (TIGR02598 family)|nr:hypothetical protein [Chthoniobacteraceae bacterium]
MRAPSRRLLGFSLVEVTLALGVAGFCLVVVMGLLPLGLNSDQASIEQTLAASVASQIYSDLRLTSKSPGSLSPRYQLAIPAATTSSTTTVTTQILKVTADGGPVDSSMQDSTVRFLVYVYLEVPPLPGSMPAQAAGAPPGLATTARILVTWPPIGGVTSGTLPGIVEPAAAVGTFETIDTLDRG